MWTWWRGTGPGPRWGIRLRRRRFWRPTGRIARRIGRCGWGRSSRTWGIRRPRRGGRGDQDGAGDAARGDAEDAARGCAHAARGLVGGCGVAADRVAAWPSAGPAAAGGGVVVRDQRDQRARDRGAGPGPRKLPRRRLRRTVLRAEMTRARGAVGVVRPLGGGAGATRRPVARAWSATIRSLSRGGRGVVAGLDAVAVRAPGGRGGCRSEQLLAGLAGLAAGDAGRRRGGRARAPGGQDGVRVPRPGLAVGSGWAPSCSIPRRYSPTTCADATRRSAEHVEWSLIDVRPRGAGRAGAGSGGRGAAGAVGGDGVAGRAVALGGRGPRCGDRPFAGRDRGRVCGRRAVAGGRRPGGGAAEPAAACGWPARAAWCRWRVALAEAEDWWRGGATGSVSPRSTVSRRWPSPATWTP